jgi:outer membrane biosynthesis protein TonB
LAVGPNPVEIPVPRKTSDEDPQPGRKTQPKEGRPDAPPTPADLKETQPPPSPQETPRTPAFRGYQRKTVIQGSISRSGRSALDVEDSPLGRYQATISRAVELEWQRNCVRYRDSITPGFLTVRFFVDAKGKVRNVQSVGPMQTGQIQKGFTFNSIHDATIPAMPRELLKDYQEEPLELVFNFYF